jgi:ubiquinone biosynthesis protein
MPRLLHLWLQQQVEGKHALNMQSHDLRALTRALQSAQRRTIAAIFGTGLLVVASLLYALEAGGPRLFGVPASAWIAALGAAWALRAAWPRQS